MDRNPITFEATMEASNNSPAGFFSALTTAIDIETGSDADCMCSDIIHHIVGTMLR